MKGPVCPGASQPLRSAVAFQGWLQPPAPSCSAHLSSFCPPLVAVPAEEWHVGEAQRFLT